ncbi:hypothetical protein Plhal304r1_c088g0170551 [Plasmopara halstedii]
MATTQPRSIRRWSKAFYREPETGFWTQRRSEARLNEYQSNPHFNVTERQLN